jgi:hypothetical protein
MIESNPLWHCHTSKVDDRSRETARLCRVSNEPPIAQGHHRTHSRKTCRGSRLRNRNAFSPFSGVRQSSWSVPCAVAAASTIGMPSAHSVVCDRVHGQCLVLWQPPPQLECLQSIQWCATEFMVSALGRGSRLRNRNVSSVATQCTRSNSKRVNTRERFHYAHAHAWQRIERIKGMQLHGILQCKLLATHVPRTHRV